MTTSSSTRNASRVRRPSPAGVIGLSAALLIGLSAAAAPGAQGPVGRSSPLVPPAQAAPPPPETADGGVAPTAPFPPGGLPSFTGPIPPLPDDGPRVRVTPGTGIPATVLDAYRSAQQRSLSLQPGCHLPVTLLAAIGQVESGQARGGQVDAAGTTLRPILGPVLDGGAFAAVPDTDGGRWDGDPVWDRAVGPLQFIPGTWARWASDGNGDAISSPHNVYDAGLAAARYLCAGRDLATPGGLTAAILSYNHSVSYLNLVRAWMNAYSAGLTSLPGPDSAVSAPAVPGPSAVAAAGPTSRTPAPPAPAAPPSSGPQPPAGPAPAPTPTPPPPPSRPPVAPVNPVPDPVCGVTDALGDLWGTVLGGLLGGTPPASAACTAPPSGGPVP
ncbi:lytic transglycosylase domain-containing protein [Amycolatopsis sp. PS_44_ISF1]|uniref:lytic transglycosylase domain-containing protein n=1 Tax=Amycolatopsis sp. PS_44_ISF1 TaxID=2974917 RepID=UPI0028DF4AF5|nr:lytic transglycosylase domain-containing protein [Amycolatopsis sp. PS_44_ISF1]MDT8913141.1 lytic transglycosylase domain-containing protein [Amycolatopsis sp. PS_44_ISF1]